MADPRSLAPLGSRPNRTPLHSGGSRPRQHQPRRGSRDGQRLGSHETQDGGAHIRIKDGRAEYQGYTGQGHCRQQSAKASSDPAGRRGPAKNCQEKTSSRSRTPPVPTPWLPAAQPLRRDMAVRTPYTSSQRSQGEEVSPTSSTCGSQTGQDAAGRV